MLSDFTAIERRRKGSLLMDRRAESVCSRILLKLVYRCIDVVLCAWEGELTQPEEERSAQACCNSLHVAFGIGFLAFAFRHPHGEEQEEEGEGLIHQNFLE